MTASRLSERIGQMFDDRFQLLAVLGESTTSMIYLALDSVVDRRVVVRVLRDELATDGESVDVFRQRMQRESSLMYDNILPVYVSGEVPSALIDGADVPYFVTEFLGGGSLRTMLDEHDTLGLSQVVRIGIDVSKALANAHKKSSLHLDLRPENILFADDAEQSLRVKDFGLARALAESSLTEPIAAGPSAQVYAAPEILSGGEVDGRSDVYSLGLVLAECLTGEVPLTGRSTADTYRLRTTEDFVPTVDFGPLQAIIASMCTTERTDRPDAATLVRELEDLAASLEAPAPLPIVPTLGVGSQTLELDRNLITTTPAVGTDHRSDTAAAGDRPDLEGSGLGTGPSGPDKKDRPAERAEPASDPEARFGVAVDDAELKSILATSRPASLGPVEPLTTDGAGRSGRRRRRRGDHTDDSGERRSRRGLWIGLAVVLLFGAAAGGVAYWFYEIRVPTHDVPTVVGSQRVDAIRSLEQLGFVVEITGSKRVDGTTVDEVLTQDPDPDTVLGEGDTVNLTVSLGQTLRTLPRLDGMLRDEAVDALKASDLVLGTETPAHDEEIPAGMVMSFATAADGPQPDEHGEVPRDTVVDLVVSDGPAPRRVPDGLVGASVQDARAALEALQLEVTVLEEYNETVPAGVVVSSDADPGQMLERGSRVTLKMSKGPEPITVPNVIGMTGSAATSKLESLGFKVRGIEGSPSGTVLQTDPTPGEKHPKGTSVRIFTRN